MLTIREVYERFDAIGCVDFTTVDGSLPQSRIAHFFACDDGGLYFRTMYTKPFYRQLKRAGVVSACGMYPRSQLAHDAAGLPVFDPGYTIRVSGSVRELENAEVAEKAKGNPDFHVAAYDIEKYPATRVFVLYSAWGEVFDYDFERERRDHKLERERFAFGGAEFEPPGLSITDACVQCGACKDVCSFDAIEAGSPYRILGNRCDECGDCYVVCPAGAVASKGE